MFFNLGFEGGVKNRFTLVFSGFLRRFSVFYKNRLTLGEKLPMFVIGKSVKPRCFKGVINVPCRYHAQKKNWMDSGLFEEWVREEDWKFDREGRKVALKVDNCPAHPNISNLKAISLVFLPPNSTSKTQPMDQGVIRAAKAYYSQGCVKKFLDAIENRKPLPNLSFPTCYEPSY